MFKLLTSYFRCRANHCGGCKPEFYDDDCNPVDCCFEDDTNDDDDHDDD